MKKVREVSLRTAGWLALVFYAGTLFLHALILLRVIPSSALVHHASGASVLVCQDGVTETMFMRGPLHLPHLVYPELA